MKRINKSMAMVTVLALLLCSGCSTLSTGTKTPTQDEQARIIIGGFQTILPTLKTAGDVYVTAQPQYQSQWQLVAIPAFIQCNQFLAGLEAQGAAGKSITPAVVMAQLQAQMVNIVSLYAEAGMIPSASGTAKLTPEQTALLITGALAQGTLLMDQLTGLFSGNIPTWQAIVAQNAAFQIQLTAK